MYRKDKVAVAVDSYKRKYSDDENEDSLQNNSNNIDKENKSEKSSSDERNEIIEDNKTKAIKSVKAANRATNLIEKKQVEGFNMFLNKIKPTDNRNSNNQNSSNKVKNFEIIDRNKKYYPPNQFTVTSINQAHDLLRVQNNPAVSGDEQSSEDWLKTHNLDALQLTIEDLISKGKLGNPRPDEQTGTAYNCLVYDDFIVTDYEYKLHMAIEMYSKRIKWYLQGSRKMFGFVSGSKLAVLIDSSDANLGFGRVISFQDNLLHLLDEQLFKKKSINIGYFGTNTKFLYQDFMNLNCRVIEEIKESFSTMSSLGGCNLMQALKYVTKEKSIDEVLLILGSCPDQEAKMLMYFVQQLLLGRDLPFHCVSYETQSEEVSSILKYIATISHGNYHRYSSMTEELMYTSNDIDLLLLEIERTQEVLEKIELMRRGIFSNRASPYINQIAEELKNIPQSENLPKPISFNDPLKFEVPKFEPRTSSEWLGKSGLKAKKLGLYSSDVFPLRESNFTRDANISRKSIQGRRFSSTISKPVKSRISQILTIDNLKEFSQFGSEFEGIKESTDEKRFIEMFTENILSKNAYESKSEFIPSIGRMVTSSVYEKAMIQVEWPDGSVRNVHADLAQLFEYQKLLGEQVKLMEQRITWLSTGSRRIFGTIIERKVILILDLSISNIKYLVHILQSLKILIQQQLKAKDKFNIIAFSNTISSFKAGLTVVNETNLQDSWSWLRSLNCSGSRNLLGALKHVFENPVDSVHNDYAQGIYLFTSGVPDQQIEPLMAYIEERVLGTDIKIHTVLFNVDDYDVSGTPIPSRYANITKTAEIMRMLAHSTKGRFHWFRESGIIESDDIRVLMAEIDLAVEYSRRTQQIINDYKEKYPPSHSKKNEDIIKNAVELCRRNSSDNMVALMPPRQTSLSKARLKYLSDKTEENLKIPKTLAYKSDIDPRKSITNSKPPYRPVIQSAFYTEDKNSKGVVYRDYPGQNMHSRRGIGKAVIPDKEEWITSKDWMKKYSLKNMGLDLLRLVSGPECRHEEALIIPLEKYVEAKYCAGLFPIVNVKGTRKHLQYTVTELNKYSVEAKKALIRYMKRLEWLMISSKRIFGVITETDVAILLDTSGSMTPHMPELILNLKALIWEQLFKRKISYNIIAFNSQIRRFRERLVTPDESSCHSAIGWTEHLVACGNTDTTKALLITLEDPRIQGIYLLTDGKPDNSTEIVLKNVQNMMSSRKTKVPIHTISFNCEDESANEFLKRLARMSNGRYHKVCHDYDIRMFSQRVIEQSKTTALPQNDIDTKQDRTTVAADLLSIDPHYPPLPNLEGDDLVRLAKEIQLTRENLAKINYFRQLHIQLQKYQEQIKAEEIKAHLI